MRFSFLRAVWLSGAILLLVLAVPLGPPSVSRTGAHPSLGATNGSNGRCGSGAGAVPCAAMAWASTPPGPLPSYGPWRQLGSGSNASPGQRSSAAMAYDPLLGEVVLFGGYNSSAYPYGDTWVFANGNWTNISASLTRSPPAVWGDSMAYDPDLKGIVLFGGRDSLQFYNFTWLFNATGWWDITRSVGPGPRMVMAMAYDVHDRYLFGLGGSFYNGAGWVSYNDSWKLTLSGWTNVTGSVGGSPPAVPYGAGTWDATDGYFLVFGGGSIGSCGTISVTWSYTGGSWTNRTGLSPTYPPTPSGSTAMSYDPLNHSVILFGGYPPAPCTSPLNQTWAYQGGRWSNLTPGLVTTPSARCCASVAYDPLEPGLVMFGGNGNPITPARLNDTWRFDGRGGEGVQVKNTPSVAEAGQTVVLNGTPVALTGPLLWNWSFGDGAVATDAGANVSHSYAVAALYNVVANVTDGNGTVWLGKIVVRVVTPLAAAPAVTPTIADSPATIQYRANATGGVLPLTYLWNFSNGARSTAASGTFLTAIVANYSVAFSVRDANGWARFFNATFRVYPSLGVVTSLSPLVAIAPFTVLANATVSGGDPPASPTWNFTGFGGSVAHSLSANHTYRFPGSYLVSFSALDSARGRVSVNYTVDSLLPLTASAKVTQAAGVVPFTAYFSSSVLGGGGSYSYVWNFSDGSPDATDSTPSHTFTQAGTYPVRLQTKDQFGFEANSSVLVYVVTPLAIAVMVNATIGVAPITANFSVTSSGGFGALDGLWVFGDGGTAHGNGSVSHLYHQAGSYSVLVTVTDALGESARAGVSFRTVDPLLASLVLEPNVSFAGVAVALIASASQGLTPYTFTWGGLPAGCAIGNATRGPCNSTIPGSYPVWVRVTDALGERVNDSATLILKEPTTAPIQTPPSSNASGSSGGPGLTVIAAVAAGVIVAVAAALVIWRMRSRGPPPREMESAAPAPGPAVDPVSEGGPSFYDPPDESG
ncbi:MAG: PKD domain-containing protein [Thermoplasmata archaeon]|nr:PKD domain-containing protein [Thermoplasmata archaeon]